MRLKSYGIKAIGELSSKVKCLKILGENKMNRRSKEARYQCAVSRSDQQIFLRRKASAGTTKPSLTTASTSQSYNKFQNSESQSFQCPNGVKFSVSMGIAGINMQAEIPRNFPRTPSEVFEMVKEWNPFFTVSDSLLVSESPWKFYTPSQIPGPWSLQGNVIHVVALGSDSSASLGLDVFNRAGILDDAVTYNIYTACSKLFQTNPPRAHVLGC